MTLATSCAATMLAFVALASPVDGQGWASGVPGMRVSIRVVDSFNPGYLGRNAVVGTILHRDSAFFYLRVTSADTLRVSQASITRLAVSKGRSRARSAVKYAPLEGALFSLLTPVCYHCPRRAQTRPNSRLQSSSIHRSRQPIASRSPLPSRMFRLPRRAIPTWRCAHICRVPTG